MTYIFTTTSSMEFEKKEDLEAVVAMMPWQQGIGSMFLKTGEYSETEESELEGTDEVIHKFTITEV